MKKNILAIMVAVNHSISKRNVTVEDLLAEYSVGAEGEKKWQKKTHFPPKPSKLCPIYNFHNETS